MKSAVHSQEVKLGNLVRAAVAGQGQAERGTLFCSRAGLAIVNAAFDLFECDALYDLASDVAREAGLNRSGQPLDSQGECL